MKNNNLIAVNGKIGHGKDTVGNIIQIFTALPHLTDTGVKSFLGREIDSPYKIKKFADKLKDMVCLLIGCSREQLEDREFKEKELGEEWWYWDIDKYPNLPDNCLKLTPRKLLQLLGTECGREILHPNIWVNSLFADYIPNNIRCNNCYWYGEEQDLERGEDEESAFDGCPTCNTDNYLMDIKQSKWIITDLRFSNEFEAVKDRGGITIKVHRDLHKGNTHVAPVPHESETALDNETRWDYVIDNNSTIEDLIKKVREILNKENII